MYTAHPGAEAREPQKTFVGRQLDVCEVREPAANLSIEVRIGSGSRAGASLFAAGPIRSWTVNLMCIMTKHVHGAAVYLTRQIIFFTFCIDVVSL